MAVAGKGAVYRATALAGALLLVTVGTHRRQDHCWPSSRLIVPADRPSSAAIAVMVRPARRRSAIVFRSFADRYRAEITAGRGRVIGG